MLACWHYVFFFSEIFNGNVKRPTMQLYHRANLTVLSIVRCIYRSVRISAKIRDLSENCLPHRLREDTWIFGLTTVQSIEDQWQEPPAGYLKASVETLYVEKSYLNLNVCCSGLSRQFFNACMGFVAGVDRCWCVSLKAAASVFGRPNDTSIATAYA